MSLYDKAWSYLKWGVVVGICSLLSTALLLDLIGNWGVLGMSMWFIYGLLGHLDFVCPRCGRSMFRSGIVYNPWPQRNCTGCGYDLTQA